MPDGLKIVVDADVQQATKALATDIPKAVDAAVSAATKLGGAFDNANLKSQHAAQGIKNSFEGVSDQVKKAGKQISIFEGSIETLQARIGARKSFLNTETDIKKIAALNKEISLLELQVSHLSNTGRTRFDQLGTAITRTSAASRAAATSINLTGLSLNSIGAGASKAFAGLLRLSYILPGIGTAGIIGGILTVAGALVGIGTGAKAAEVDVSILAAKMKAAEDAQKAFTEAVSQASSEIVSQSASLSDLKSILISTSTETKNLTKDTINLGVAQFLFDKKNLAVQQLLTAQIEKQLQFRKEQRPFADLGEFKASTLRNDQFTQGFVNDPLNKKIDEAKDAIKTVNELSFGLDELFKDIFNKQFPVKELKVKPDKIDLFIPDVKVKKAISPEFTIDFKNLKIGLLEGDIKTFGEKVQDKINSEINSLVIAPKFAISEQGKQTDAAIKFAEDIAKAFSEGLANALSTGLSGIGEVLGTALGGGDIGNALKAFASSIGEAISAIGKQVIALGTAALLAKQSFKFLFDNPALAIAAGVALVAAGSAFKNILSGGIKGFAQGGLVSGPQLALIGEGSGTSRSNPEVVAPLDKLKAMIGDAGGGRQVVVLRTQISGNNLALVQARTSRSQRRTTGR